MLNKEAVQKVVEKYSSNYEIESSELLKLLNSHTFKCRKCKEELEEFYIDDKFRILCDECLNSKDKKQKLVVQPTPQSSFEYNKIMTGSLL